MSASELRMMNARPAEDAARRALEEHGARIEPLSGTTEVAWVLRGVVCGVTVSSDRGDAKKGVGHSGPRVDLTSAAALLPP